MLFSIVLNIEAIFSKEIDNHQCSNFQIIYSKHDIIETNFISISPISSIVVEGFRSAETATIK